MYDYKKNADKVENLSKKPEYRNAEVGLKKFLAWLVVYTPNDKLRQ